MRTESEQELITVLKMPTYDFWFVTGSQDLYGPAVLEQVAEHARLIADGLDKETRTGHRIVFQQPVTSAEAARRLVLAANADDNCAGVIVWMHTFSPAQLWIAGLSLLHKPMLHLHTQYHREIPWSTIDMDYMNMHQSAHGDREFGYITTRLGIRRHIVVGHWQDPEVHEEIDGWLQVAMAVHAGRSLKIARFGDNMRHVAVTEGDKVAANERLGWSVVGYGVGDLVEHVRSVSEADVERTVDEYRDQYVFPPATRDSAAMDAVKEQARIELGLRSFLESGGYTAFTTTFEDLHGLRQLPGLAVQRLMADGYGFGAEGDWKTAGLVRAMKLIARGQGTTFMEDYTYHFGQNRELILGAHMLEVCPTIAADTPRVEVHPLSIGGKEDPARLVFNGRSGPAVNACLIDLGHRFRLVINLVEAEEPTQPLPKLPVARVLWRPYPSLRESARAWILAGGAHHTCFSYNVSVDQLVTWAEMLDLEAVVIDHDTTERTLRNELRWNEYGRRS